MGDPTVWYKVALQELCSYLKSYNACETYFGSHEEGIEKLEEFILNEKLQVDEKIFYYCAGIATMATLKAADEVGCDSFNASCGGLCQFEDFIGLPHEEDDDE